MPKMYAQGDVLLVAIDPPEFYEHGTLVDTDPDGFVVLARGEKSGHRHGFWDSVALFRDDVLARDVVIVKQATQLIQHALDPSHPDVHDPVDVPPGIYKVIPQRRLEIIAPDEVEVRRAID